MNEYKTEKSVTIALTRSEADLFKVVLDNKNIKYTEIGFGIYQKRDTDKFTGNFLLELPYTGPEDLNYYSSLFKEAMELLYPKF